MTHRLLLIAQEVSQVVTPPGGVLTLAKATDASPIKYLLDAAT